MCVGNTNAGDRVEGEWAVRSKGCRSNRDDGDFPEGEVTVPTDWSDNEARQGGVAKEEGMEDGCDARRGCACGEGTWLWSRFGCHVRTNGSMNWGARGGG